MTRSIEVSGNYGTLTVDTADGLVTDYEPSAEGDDYKTIVRFNLDEWRWRYHAELCGLHDILDFGYWTDDGRYEPPAADWREQMAAMQEVSEAYHKIVAGLCGPMGRVL